MPVNATLVEESRNYESGKWITSSVWHKLMWAAMELQKILGDSVSLVVGGPTEGQRWLTGSQLDSSSHEAVTRDQVKTN